MANTPKLSKEEKKAAEEKEKAAKKMAKFAKKSNVKTDFFVHNHCVYRTKDGKHYPTLELFWADGGAKDGANVTNL